jgi:hypothetical protein
LLEHGRRQARLGNFDEALESFRVAAAIARGTRDETEVGAEAEAEISAIEERRGGDRS